MMRNQPLITVYTQVYNTREDWLRQCIESVLGQTYTNFEYFILDNGSTDGSSEILKEYAQRVQNIHLIRWEANIRGWGFEKLRSQASGIYFACLDSDDWWEPDYLEQMLGFLQENHLDIALTGTVAWYQERKQSEILRKLDNPLVFTQEQFAQRYSNYWTFPSTVWACLMPLKMVKEINIIDLLQKQYAYGTDTMLMLRYLEKCQRIGINSSALYHYRIRKSSVSYEFNPKRFEANLAYCKCIQTFLENHNAFDRLKREWLKRVYFASVTETIRLAMEAKNPIKEKLEVCAEITAHPRTAEALQSNSSERTKFLDILHLVVSITIQQGPEKIFEALRPILQLVCPRCSDYISVRLLKLCQKDNSLLLTLFKDDQTGLALTVLELISQSRYSRQFDLPDVLAELLPKSPLSVICDDKFYRKYFSICADIVKGNSIGALDKMTEALMNSQVAYAMETYLQLYLTLAALEQQIPAFLFGKVQLAQYYLEQKNHTACENILLELDEMGMEEQEDVIRIKTLLKETKPAT